MSLMDAPTYDPRRDILIRNLSIAGLVLVVLIILTGLAGRMTGHGWFFTNLAAEHRVNSFFDALEAKDYPKAYGIYNNDADWQQHPQKYTDYPLARFTEDWTTESPVHTGIVNHHVDVSATDGTGFWGTGTIVAVRVNGSHKLFMFINRADGTMTWPAAHIIQY
jgi:hypothetical protein